MPPKKKYTETLRDKVVRVVNELQCPTPVAEVLQKILARSAGSSESTIRDYLRQQTGNSFVYLDSQTIIPIHLALQRLRFRINLDKEPKLGFLFTWAFEPFFLSFQPAKFQFIDQGGMPLPTCLIKPKKTGNSLAAFLEPQGFSLPDWFRQEKIQPGDSTLVTIVQLYPHPLFRLEHEPAANRRNEDIRKQNQELADILFGLLEQKSREAMMVQEGILTAYCRLKDPRGYPGDHWQDVLEQDGRMRYDYFQIVYADDRYPPTKMLSGDTVSKKTKRVGKLPSEQANLVYCFKASFRHRPTIWRCLELQGQHTLSAFDQCLRGAFHHEVGDHLSGFWKLTPRSGTKRFRETEIANIEPFGTGEGAELRIADLQLMVGAQLKYVYDFGDWIEHRIILEEILEPDPKVKYPRLAGQNKPHRKYCEECREQNIKEIATWVCIDCSEEAARPVLVCEACFEKCHEDHNAQEWEY